MRAVRINHVSVVARDLEASARFYETLFGTERIPTPNFGFPVVWMRLGHQQLHIFRFDEPAPWRNHFALDVDDFVAVYEKAKALGVLDYETFGNCMYELPDGAVQMYVRDPGGNLVEVDWPDPSRLDRARLPELERLADRFPQEGEAARATLYHSAAARAAAAG